MRKLFLGLALSALLVGISQASVDMYGSERNAVWRSSRTDGSVNFTALSTGAIIIHSVVIESPTVNLDSFISIYNGTQTAAGQTFNFNISTGIGLSTVVNGLTSGAFPQNITYDVPFSSGAIINKVGNAWINILWDYVVPTRKVGSVPFRP